MELIVDVSLIFSTNVLLNKQSNGRWFETPCDVTVMQRRGWVRVVVLIEIVRWGYIYIYMCVQG